MNLPRFAVERPIFASMIGLMVVVLGLAATARLRIDMLPAVEVPTVSVRTSYEGADPAVVERLVTQIVEEIINTVPGVTELSSESSEGRSQIRATFAWGTDLDVAVSDIRARLEEELSELPDGINPPQIRKFDISSFPVVLLGISSSDLDPVELNDIVERQVRYRFARLPGVAQVDLWGGYSREIRVELNPDRLQALGLAPQAVIQALRNANLDLPAGSIEQGRLEVVLRAPAEFASLDQLRATVIEMRDGAAIRLDQVATVHDTYERLTRMVRVDRELGIRVAIRKEADANTVEVARQILAEIDETNRALPQIKVVPVINQGNFIERSIANVARSVLYGGALAVLVLLFFLRSVRSTVVIAVAIPLSILATMALVYAGGLTLNLMTLGGLALGVGMMVDSSIVVLENIFRRHDENDETAHEAAVSGASEVAGAIVASTITTLVIFLPLLFVAGVSGLLFGELALVVVYSLIASLVVALTLVPMLAARLLHGSKATAQMPAVRQGLVARLVAASGRGLTALEHTYGALLAWALRHRFVTLGASAVALAASLTLWPHIGTEFLPPSDEGSVRVSGTFESGTRLAVADRQAKKIEQIVFDAVPEIESAVTNVSASGGRGRASASTDISLNVGPIAGRDRSNTEIANDLRKRLVGQVAGVEVRTRAPQGQFLLERLLGGDTGIEVEIRGYELPILEDLAQRVAAIAEGIAGVTDTEDDLEDSVPQQHLTIDRAKVADMGLSVREVAEVLEAALAGRLAGDYRPQGQSVPIRIQVADIEHLTLDAVLAQTISVPGGEAVALRNLMHVEAGIGPAKIIRKDQQRAITVSLNLDGRDPGSVAQDLEQALAAMPLPAGYQVRVGGSYEEQGKSARELGLSLLLALLLVYMVLACQYESLRDPLVVMFSVPVAAIGVLVTLYITRSTMNLQSGIGCIMLGGIVVNNAILLVDQAGRLRTEGMPTMAALAEAGRRRLRPILMTTATTILGLLPLALGIGEGADAQAPLARAVIGGLAASTVITLLLIPVLYSFANPDRAARTQGA
ncbi:MAG: efflux RND transporter permease subunit [Planctomycetota bacterium]|jgi:HAE1 family hydrophobic/amphiphilic exporter-1|nr:efflux RND transporter permease subunit [Planctomycetota bacterium]